MSFVSPKGIVCATRLESEVCDGRIPAPWRVQLKVELVPKDDAVVGGSYAPGFYPGSQSLVTHVCSNTTKPKSYKIADTK